MTHPTLSELRPPCATFTTTVNNNISFCPALSMTIPPEEPQGSWTPFVLVLLGVIFWWAFYSQSPQAVKFRRWYNLQRVQWKKKLGLRDESIYKNGAAGDGANQRHKRQG